MNFEIGSDASTWGNPVGVASAQVARGAAYRRLGLAVRNRSIEGTTGSQIFDDQSTRFTPVEKFGLAAATRGFIDNQDEFPVMQHDCRRFAVADSYYC